MTKREIISKYNSGLRVKKIVRLQYDERKLLDKKYKLADALSYVEKIILQEVKRV